MTRREQLELAKPLRRFKPYPAYKDSGVEWLGHIPAHWGVKRLKHLAAVNSETLPEDTDPQLEMSYVDIGGVDSLGRIVERERLTFASAPSRARRLVRDGDVIVSTVRTYLRAISPIRNPDPGMVVSTGFAVVRLQKDLTTEFAAYALRAPYFVERVVANSKGVSFPAINESDMAAFELTTPPEPEQRAIAAFLDRETARIDALIAKKERLIAVLQEKRAALISRAVTKGLDPSAPRKDSGVAWLGEIPNHWNIMRLRHVGETIIGLTYQPDDVVGPDEGILVLRASNVREGRITYEDSVFVRAAVPDHLRTRDGDILICARSGSRDLIGKNARIQGDAVGVTFGAFMSVFRSPHNAFLYYVFNSALFEYQSGTFLTSTINQLTAGNLKDMVVPIPPQQEQEGICNFLDAEAAKIDAVRSTVRVAVERLKELRSTLVSAAVTGKIDIREQI